MNVGLEYNQQQLSAEGSCYPPLKNQFTMKLIIAKVMFIIRLQSGVIVPSTDPDGKVLYAIPQDSIEYAYKKEIIQYYRTGEFKYDDTLDDKVDTASFK